MLVPNQLWHDDEARREAEKSRSEYMSKVSKREFGFRHAYWPYSYDQLSFKSPTPMSSHREFAAWVLTVIPATAAVPMASVVLPGDLRVMGDPNVLHR